MPRKQCTVKAQALQAILTEVVDEANRISGFSQRKRQCDARILVQTLVLGWLENPAASLAELSRMAGRFGCTISAQGLNARLNERAVVLLTCVLAESIRRLQQTQRLPIGVLEHFTGVYITDSTQFKLPNDVYAEFRGTGPQQAQGKWQVTLEYLRGELRAVQWAEGRQPDQRCDLPLEVAQPGSLHLFDLGYFKQERLAALDQHGAYFVSRYQSQTALYGLGSGTKLDLAQYLQQTSANEIELHCILGRKQLVTVRVVARRLSPAAAAEQRRKARQKARKQKKACSKSYLLLLGWEIMVTNLPAADYPLALIFAFYGIRWQIELLFKTWKSQLKVVQFRARCITRVFCQLLARLIACVVCQWWTSGYRWWHGHELSITRMIQTVRTYIPDIMRCIARRWRGLHIIFQQVEAEISRFARKEKRKKSPSTLHILINWGLT